MAVQTTQEWSTIPSTNKRSHSSSISSSGTVTPPTMPLTITNISSAKPLEFKNKFAAIHVEEVEEEEVVKKKKSRKRVKKNKKDVQDGEVKLAAVEPKEAEEEEVNPKVEKEKEKKTVVNKHTPLPTIQEQDSSTVIINDKAPLIHPVTNNPTIDFRVQHKKALKALLVGLILCLVVLACLDYLIVEELRSKGRSWEFVFFGKKGEE